ncbi:MAG: UbiX family flavin prenyltransferase [Bacteroidales bacterium]|nr:UbiX family flavin prenyltransferase [Bacteroidales bacterium]
MSKPSHFYHLILSITGASGAVYAARFLDKAQTIPHLQLSILLSKNAEEVWKTEVKRPLPQAGQWRYWDLYDFSAPFASGSNCADAMLILPCSMGTAARIACGISDTLITRAADVMLKEQRPLVIVPREAPFNLIHLRNLTQLCESGATIVPASPAFYHQPQSIDLLIDPFIDRLLFLSGATPKYDGFKWGG